MSMIKAGYKNDLVIDRLVSVIGFKMCSFELSDSSLVLQDHRSV